jgi:pimeloyl-ACP methyl ester carboxylesterase
MERPVRRGYPADGHPQPGRESSREGSVLVGYSWGSLVALRTAADSHARPRAIVLIAPCLQPRPASALRRAIVRAPWLGTALLARCGTTLIGTMLAQSAHPCSIPDTYQRQAARLARSVCLRQAVLEKSEPGLPAAAALETVHARSIPLAVIRGTDDRISPQQDQLNAIRRCVPGVIDVCLEQAGHALPWTHPLEVARAIQDLLAAIQRTCRRIAS